jgi:two-component system chemotaxis response regulator CheY
MTETKRKVRVLLADDEPHVRLFVKSLLAGMGCQVVAEAANGQEALDLFDKTAPDLVLLDVNMPVMDGLAALVELRKRSEKVAIVMLTSLAGADIVEESLAAGANYHLRKDLPVAELRQEIRDTWPRSAVTSRAAPRLRRCCPRRRSAPWPASGAASPRPGGRRSREAAPGEPGLHRRDPQAGAAAGA